MMNSIRQILQRAANLDTQIGQRERRIGARAPVQVEAGELTGGQDVFPAVVDAVVGDVGEVMGQVARM